MKRFLAAGLAWFVWATPGVSSSDSDDDSDFRRVFPRRDLSTTYSSTIRTRTTVTIRDGDSTYRITRETSEAPEPKKTGIDNKIVVTLNQLKTTLLGARAELLSKLEDKTLSTFDKGVLMKTCENLAGQAFDVLKSAEKIKNEFSPEGKDEFKSALAAYNSLLEEVYSLKGYYECELEELNKSAQDVIREIGYNIEILENSLTTKDLKTYTEYLGYVDVAYKKLKEHTLFRAYKKQASKAQEQNIIDLIESRVNYFLALNLDEFFNAVEDAEPATQNAQALEDL